MTKKGLKKSADEFIDDIKNRYGNYYDLSEVNYVNSKTKVTIICPKHGRFSKTPNALLNGCGCNECKRELSEEKQSKALVNRLRKIVKYDFNEKDVKTTYDKVKCYCPIHGEFEITAKRMLKGCGCTRCSQKKKLTNGEIKEELREVYGDRFILNEVEYKNRKAKVTLICKKHGKFQILPSKPYPSNPCKDCGTPLYSSYDFIRRCIQIHGEKYDYNDTKYINSKEDIEIDCPKHGKFKQVAYAHLRGEGCPRCNQSKLEETIAKKLKENGIKYIQNDRSLLDCSLELDFYLPDYNAAIECQGIQHFIPIDYFGGKVNYIKQVERDELKREKCSEKNIKLLYYSNLGINYGYDVEEDIDRLIEKIINR